MKRDWIPALLWGAILAVFTLVLFAQATSAAAPWANSSCYYRINCTMNSHILDTAGTGLTNFPGFCNLNTSITSNATLINATSGANFRVYDNASVPLNFDIDLLNGSTFGASASINMTLWISSNFTTGDHNQSFAYIYFCPTTTPNGENSHAVFCNDTTNSANYTSVWHLGNATDECGLNDLAASGTVSYVTEYTTPKCKWGGCANLTTSSYLYRAAGTATYPTVSAPSTMSAWSWRSMFKNGDAYGAALMAFGGSGYRYLRSIITAGGGSTTLRYTDENVIAGTIAGAMQNNTWIEFYSAVSNSSSSHALYKNTTTAQGNSAFGQTLAAGAIMIGTETENTNNRQWFHSSSENGTIEEARLAATNRSPDWLRAEYNMSSTTGAVENLPLTATYGTAVQNASCYVDSFVNFSVTVSASGGGTALCNWTSAPTGYLNHSVLNNTGSVIYSINDTNWIAWNCTDSQFNYTILYNMSAPQQTNWTMLANGSMASNVSQDSSITYVNVYWFNTTKGLPANYNASGNANPILTLNPGGNHTLVASRIIGLPLFGSAYTDMDEALTVTFALLTLFFAYCATESKNDAVKMSFFFLTSIFAMADVFFMSAVANYSATVAVGAAVTNLVAVFAFIVSAFWLIWLYSLFSMAYNFLMGKKAEGDGV